MEQKYFKVSEIARIFGIEPKTVRKYCRSRAGKTFAFKPYRGANYKIDFKKFESYIKTFTA